MSKLKNPKKTTRHDKSAFAKKLEARPVTLKEIRVYLDKLLKQLMEEKVALSEAFQILSLTDIFVDEYGKAFNILFEAQESKKPKEEANGN